MSKEHQDRSQPAPDLLPIAATVPADLAAIKLLLTARETAQALGVSLRTLRSWDSSGRIPQPRRISRSTKWSVSELRDWTNAGCPRREEWEAVQSANGKK